MSKHYDLTKPPKFIRDIFAKFRKWKLSRYKKKKVRIEKASGEKKYFVKFLIKVDDPINPQESDFEYEMIVPAKAAFIAKKKTVLSIKKKLDIEFIECEEISDEEYEDFEESLEEYEKTLT